MSPNIGKFEHAILLDFWQKYDIICNVRKRCLESRELNRLSETAFDPVSGFKIIVQRVLQ